GPRVAVHALVEVPARGAGLETRAPRGRSPLVSRLARCARSHLNQRGEAAHQAAAPYAARMSDLLAELRADLKTAMRARDRATLSTLRATIAAIENAVAQPAVNPVTMSAAASEWVAGAAVGVGATEVERRQLDDDAVRAIVRAE